LSDEDEVVVFGEVFEEEAEFTEGFDGDEVGIVYNWYEEFSFGVEVAGFGDESGFAFVIGAVVVEVEGLAEETEDVVPGVKGAVDDGGDPVLLVMMKEVVFEDGFSGAGFSEDEAEAALLGVDFDDIEVALLVGEQWGFVIDDEGVSGEAEVLADHGFLRGRFLEVIVAEVWLAVVLDGVEEDGGAEAFVVKVGDGWFWD